MPCRSCLLVVTLGVLPALSVGAQTVLDRTPNLAGAWVGAAGVLHFNFLHRFSVSSAPERKVTSTPTFLLAAGLPERTLVGVHYATNSELSPRYPNEWELFGRFAPLDQELGAPVDASAQVGYNLAARGFDGELAVARREGPVRVLAALRVLSEPREDDGADLALAAGAAVRLARGIGLSADIAAPTDRAAGERVAWSAGVNLAIPHTPHTLSLHATNTNNATIQSSSRGTGETRYGFEFTIPVTLSRYFGDGRPGPSADSPSPDSPTPESPAPESPTPESPAPDSPTPGEPGSGDTVEAEVRDFMFRPGRLVIAPGTAVVWTNGGQVTHTVTADDGSFDSGPIESGERRTMVFSTPGRFPFHCTPHPFMRGEIVVR